MKTQLLCTFTKRNRLYDTVSLIIECHDIVFNKVYVFSNEDDHHQLICTYNIPQDEDNYIEGVAWNIEGSRLSHHVSTSANKKLQLMFFVKSQKSGCHSFFSS